jgi:CheY-like chemotaxis protein
MIIKSNGESLNILYVEDDEIDIMNLKRAFAKNGIENPLYFAGNGLVALNMLRSGEINMPKIILLDINMPKMNGIEFLTELRKDEELRRIAVFVMTTSNEDKDKFDAYNLNVAGYILKPLKFEEFVTAINNLKNYWETIVFY